MMKGKRDVIVDDYFPNLAIIYRIGKKFDETPGSGWKHWSIDSERCKD